jgi:hypothetical protein
VFATQGKRLDGSSTSALMPAGRSPISSWKEVSSASSTLGSHCLSVTLHQSISARTRLPVVSDAEERLLLRARKASSNKGTSVRQERMLCDGGKASWTPTTVRMKEREQLPSAVPWALEGGHQDDEKLRVFFYIFLTNRHASMSRSHHTSLVPVDLHLPFILWHQRHIRN